jgi:hypothetical protein
VFSRAAFKQFRGVEIPPTILKEHASTAFMIQILKKTQNLILFL